ncbi:DUF4258 domain-containing protein [Patescibacteria group bacterium]|nr:DUF4258 domain-containing protein [Patescibacteria group bacterium]MBU4481054.1 DUF4258 domain-containing protein [Patescibacteria group bacterium]
MKSVIFSDHSLLQMQERGANRDEVLETIRTGEKIPVKNQCLAYRKNFQFNKKWSKKFYRLKQIMPIVKEERDKIVGNYSLYILFLKLTKINIII